MKKSAVGLDFGNVNPFIDYVEIMDGVSTNVVQRTLDAQSLVSQRSTTTNPSAPRLLSSTSPTVDVPSFAPPPSGTMSPVEAPSKYAYVVPAAFACSAAVVGVVGFLIWRGR
jgi:hypothetical protein